MSKAIHYPEQQPEDQFYCLEDFSHFIYRCIGPQYCQIVFFSKILTVDGIFYPRINIQYVVIFNYICSSFIVMQAISRAYVAGGIPFT